MAGPSVYGSRARAAVIAGHLGSNFQTVQAVCSKTAQHPPICHRLSHMALVSEEQSGMGVTALSTPCSTTAHQPPAAEEKPRTKIPIRLAHMLLKCYMQHICKPYARENSE